MELKNWKATVAHINVRDEMHGEEVVLAADIKLKGDVSNKFLNELSPGLTAALYTAEGARQGDIEVDHLTVLRFPQLAAQKWKVGMVDGEVVITEGKKEEGLTFKCNIDDVKLSLKEGGTVEIEYQVKIHPEPTEVGRISALLKRDVKVWVKPVEQPANPPTE